MYDMRKRSVYAWYYYAQSTTSYRREKDDMEGI